MAWLQIGGQLIHNGGFEGGFLGRPTLHDPFIVALKAGDTIGPWVVLAGSGKSADGEIVAWLDNQNQRGVATPTGTRFLDLTGYKDGGTLGPNGNLVWEERLFGGVLQTIVTVPGRRLGVTFRVGTNGDSRYGGPVLVHGWAVDAATRELLGVESVLNDLPGPGDKWVTGSFFFVPTGTSTEIVFRGAVGKQFIGLDEVSVRRAIPVLWVIHRFVSFIASIAQQILQGPRHGP
ncbi:MAG TPA: hypothetical protein VJZ00_08765 [Thermoanaerobaculia bacterium]|nr:hypothetical protein [Thermoanaerobaculia bacterium]